MKKTISYLITFLLLGGAIYFLTLPREGVHGQNTSATQDVPLKKELPKKVLLDKDSQDDKWGEVAFDHETHTTKNYTPDGKKLLSCVECHHTDQPAASLKPPLKTSERKVTLTLDALKAPDAVGVKLCRACHLQVGDTSAEIPKITYEGKTTPTKLTNENAYHLNCQTCHDNAIKARADLKDKIAGSEEGDKFCAKCHVHL